MNDIQCTDVVPLGETTALMRGTSAGPLAHASTLGLGMGGSESNFAIALRRLGTSVSWIGRLGADSRGDLVQREIRGRGREHRGGPRRVGAHGPDDQGTPH